MLFRSIIVLTLLYSNVVAKNENTVRVHQLQGNYQAGETRLRVLLPRNFHKNKRYRVLYVLPVVAQDENKRFGDGLIEIKKANLHNKHDIICVAPEFTTTPWFADHDSDLSKRDESHFLNVILPFVEKRYPTLDTTEGRLLVGFSKSGWGAFSLLLRYPQRFHRAAGWDPGIRIDTGPMAENERQDKIKRLFGSSQNFENYRLSSLLRSHGKRLGLTPRLIYHNTEGKRAKGGAKLHQLMVDLAIPHHYFFEPKQPHRWDSSWLSRSVAFLCNAPPPIIHVAKGLNADGSLVAHYKRGLEYAIEYFGNYGPYHIYLLGSGNEASVRAIYRKRAESRVDPNAKESIEHQIEAFLKQPNTVAEIDSVLDGNSEGGLTWSQDAVRIYEDVTTNASGRERDPIENTWGALHEYHHVYQLAHCDTSEERTSDRHFCSWMAEGMATYSSAKFMENLELASFIKYMLDLRQNGANIGRPGINEFLSKNRGYRLADESYWEKGGSAQVYYMLGAWATAYLIHQRGIDEVTVLKTWWKDILPLGKAAAFEKHMGISLDAFYGEFDTFIKLPDEQVMEIFKTLRSTPISSSTLHPSHPDYP